MQQGRASQLVQPTFVRWLAAGILLLAVACSQPPDPLESSSPEQECKILVTRILALQEKRAQRSAELNLMIDEADAWEAAGSQGPAPIPLEERRRMIKLWRETESNLRREVNALYTRAEANGCL